MTFRDGGRDVRFPERIIFEFFRLQQVRTESNIVFSIVPLIFSTAFPIFSFGTWNYIFQTLLVITLMVLKRSFCPGYLFSFVVGIGFGKMIDVHNAWVTMLPIVPTDIFPRDLSELLHKKYHRIKTTFDLTCLITTVLLSLLILHHLYGIGIGTFFCAFMTGRTVSLVQKFIGNHVEFYRLMKKEMVMPGKRCAMQKNSLSSRFYTKTQTVFMRSVPLPLPG